MNRVENFFIKYLGVLVPSPGNVEFFSAVYSVDSVVTRLASKWSLIPT